MSSDADFMDEHNAEEAKAAEKQSQIDEHGLKYDGSKIGYQPWQIPQAFIVSNQRCTTLAIKTK